MSFRLCLQDASQAIQGPELPSVRPWDLWEVICFFLRSSQLDTKTIIEDQGGEQNSEEAKKNAFFRPRGMVTFFTPKVLKRGKRANAASQTCLKTGHAVLALRCKKQKNLAATVGFDEVNIHPHTRRHPVGQAHLTRPFVHIQSQSLVRISPGSSPVFICFFSISFRTRFSRFP